MLEIENQIPLTLSSPHTFSTPPHQSCLHTEELTTDSAASTSGSRLHSKPFSPPHISASTFPFPPTLHSPSLPSPLRTREQRARTISSLPSLSTQAKVGNFQVSFHPSQYGRDDGVQFQPTSAMYLKRDYLSTQLAQIGQILHNTELVEYPLVPGTCSAPSSSKTAMISYSV